MSSTTSMANTDPAEMVLDTASAQNNASIHVDSEARISLHQQPTENNRAPGSTQDNGPNHQDGMGANNTSETIHNSTSSVNPPGDGQSEEELGAFDDSHLQVDKSKKKKKKKKSKKPKSKRGLVKLPHPSLILMI